MRTQPPNGSLRHGDIMGTSWSTSLKGLVLSSPFGRLQQGIRLSTPEPPANTNTSFPPMQTHPALILCRVYTTVRGRYITPPTSMQAQPLDSTHISITTEEATMQNATLKMFVAAVLALLLCTSVGATPDSRSLLQGNGNANGRFKCKAKNGDKGEGANQPQACMF